jgi:K+-transporting ATPase c subunit
MMPSAKRAGRDPDQSPFAALKQIPRISRGRELPSIGSAMAGSMVGA